MLKPKDFRLSEAEWEGHLAALRSRLSGRQPIDRAEAIAALERAARLLDDDNGMRFPADLREELLPLVEAATGLAIKDAGPPETVTVAEGAPAHAIPLVLGVALNLTQEYRLLSVDLSPRDWHEWKQWMSAVGIARETETATDVAENHDHYLTDSTGCSTDISLR